MNTTRIGKIARLPKGVREEVNRRLENGESGATLCAWLHGQPEVQAVLAKEFGGRPINAQNLTEWRQGGFRDWQAVQEARILAKDLGQEMLSGPEADCKVSSESLALWLATRYALATQEVYEAAGPKERWRLLREMSNGILRLRHGDISLKQMEVERGWQELRREQRGEISNPGRERSPRRRCTGQAEAGFRASPSVPSHSVVQKKVTECSGSPVCPPPLVPGTAGSANVPYTHPHPSSTRISPTEIAPLRAEPTRVIQTDSNPFKPLKVPGTRQAPLAGPIYLSPSSAKNMIGPKSPGSVNPVTGVCYFDDNDSRNSFINVMRSGS